jgi:hypothetical protein
MNKGPVTGLQYRSLASALLCREEETQDFTVEQVVGHRTLAQGVDTQI